MTIVTTDSAIAFAPQTGTTPGDDDTSKLVATDSVKYRWIPTTSLGFGTVQNQSPLPQELSGALLPRGAYKGGSYVAGSFDFIPRVDGSHLHWLLYSLCSSWVTGQDDAVAKDEEFLHYYGTGDSASVTWNPNAWDWETPDTETSKALQGGGPNNTDYYLSFKRLLPPPNADDTLTTRPGETFEDCRIPQLQLSFSPGAPVTASASVVGRKGSFVPSIADNPSGQDGTLTHWNPDYTLTSSDIPGLQNTTSVLLGCKGELGLPNEGTSLDLSLVDMQIRIGSMMTTPDQEMVLFSYHPERYKILSRAVVISMTIKKNIYDMYRNIFFNGGASWSPTTWRSGEPFKIISETGSDTEYGTSGKEFAGSLEFWAQDILWTMTPLQYSAGEILGAALTGIVLEPDSGTAAWYLMIKNDRSSGVDEAGGASLGFYDWPT